MCAGNNTSWNPDLLVGLVVNALFLCCFMRVWSPRRARFNILRFKVWCLLKGNRYQNQKVDHLENEKWGQSATGRDAKRRIDQKKFNLERPILDFHFGICVPWRRLMCTLQLEFSTGDPPVICRLQTIIYFPAQVEHPACQES